jgi:hypothetical protein
MIDRGQGFVSKQRHRLRKRDSLLTGEGEKVGEEHFIRRKESLVLYKAANTTKRVYQFSAFYCTYVNVFRKVKL